MTEQTTESREKKSRRRLTPEYRTAWREWAGYVAGLAFGRKPAFPVATGTAAERRAHDTVGLLVPGLVLVGAAAVYGAMWLVGSAIAL